MTSRRLSRLYQGQQVVPSNGFFISVRVAAQDELVNRVAVTIDGGRIRIKNVFEFRWHRSPRSVIGCQIKTTHCVQLDRAAAAER